MDRELYLPRVWIEDRDRCRGAGIPGEMDFATKPKLGLDMLARANTAGVLTGWVTADKVYGQNPAFRHWLTVHQVPFVLATRSDDTLPLAGGRRRWPPRSPPMRGNDAALGTASTASALARLPDSGHWINKVRSGMEGVECQNGAGNTHQNSRTKRRRCDRDLTSDRRGRPGNHVNSGTMGN